MSIHENKSTISDTSVTFCKKTLQDYEVISVIGNGAFGTCFKVRDKENGQIYAWKGVDYDELSESQRESLVSEIKVLRQLQHPNIVQYFHHLVNYEAKSIFIVMECCEGGDLAQLIAKAKAKAKRFEERYIWRVLFQVCRALQVCHNKIKLGTILHRDIKPANIFLDMEGNVKLGDFGLACMLKHNESFAETFVGTPYYMSPEIIKGSKYNRKSDVWAVGCLIYEMCSLRPPFKGREFNQLSANISIGNFNNIPDIYSEDLQKIITFMLEVESERRPSIDVISRHPLLVRNINNLGNDFPVLVDTEVQHKDFYVETNARRNLEYFAFRDFSSTMFSEQNSFHESYGQRRLSISGVFTPDLKDELFYSVERKIFPFNSKLQHSDPEIYESIKYNGCATANNTLNMSRLENIKKNENYNFEKLSQPDEVTRHVFDDMLENRLQAIKAKESLLSELERKLNEREQLLNEKEKYLISLEQSLVSKSQQCSKENNSFVQPNSARERLEMPLKEKGSNVPNLPPPTRIVKPIKHDDSYCTIEPNDSTFLHQPTMAKLSMTTLPAAKAFPILRKVTFQSPKKFITYNIDRKMKKTSSTNQMLASTSSKSSQDSSRSATVSISSSTSTTKRKSILSIFGLSRDNKECTRSSVTTKSSAINPKANSTTASKTLTEQKDQKLFSKVEGIISKCETAELSNIWTREHKRVAFEMLAAMNAAELSNNGYFSKAPRHKIRNSIRDRNTLQRSSVRQSLIMPSRHREQIIL